MSAVPRAIDGKAGAALRSLPILLKFLDAHEMLSVQVNPGYIRAGLSPASETAKTEAWVVLEAGEKSRIDAGLTLGTTADVLRQSLTNGTLAHHLVSITPKPGDGVFIPAGTVHSLGGDVVVFEVQQNSDVTFRLYDWGMWMRRTGQPRELEVDQALACIDFVDGAAGLVTPVVESETPVECERLFDCDAFRWSACAENHRSPSAPKLFLACWYARRAPGRSSTAVKRMPSEKATCGSCLRG